MAWIESHQELEGHPKLLLLAEKINIEPDHALGKLHRFWYWCIKYAENGDLRKWGLGVVSTHLKIDANALVDSGWVDNEPYLRVHDWWEYTKHFFWSKYKSTPKKWKSIQRLYEHPNNPRKNGSKDETPNLTIPNIKIHKEKKDIRKKFVPPTPEEVSTYAASLSFDLDGSHFCDYYQERNWKYKGNVPMKDWKTAVRLWKRNGFSQTSEKSEVPLSMR